MRWLEESLWFENLRLSSLLSVDDVVLLESGHYFYKALQWVQRQLLVFMSVRGKNLGFILFFGTIAGIIAADLLLTLIIVVVTYRCASFRRQQIDNADKVYMNVRANLKNIK
uniref:Hematopoietic cell signal transducer n=1 Tax=Poecilia latipinna TaxID=48699 RepID=A0A3B3TQA6_9TELE